MKKRRITGIVVLIILAVLAAVAVWQWNNITAGIYYLRYTQEELDQKLAASRQAIADKVEQLPGVTVQPLSEEQRSQLQSGQISQEQAIQIMTAPPEAEAVSPAPAPALPDEEGEKRQRIAELIAEVYLLRDIYKAKLEEVKDGAFETWKALPESERTDKKRNELLSGCIDQATVMETDCDDRMDAILSELGALLSELGESSDLAEQVKAAYAEEKAVTKAYYLNMAE